LRVFRGSVLVRDATPDDVPELAAVWAVDPDPTEAVASLGRIGLDPEQRLLVALVDDRVAGAAHLTRGPLAPLTADTAVYVAHLQVRDECRRHGVGHALLEAAVTWAEETGTDHLITAAAVSSRDANRFMARLGFGQIAVVRGATVAALRAKLPVETPVAARVGARVGARRQRNVGQVLAARRSLRRSQAHGS
jgi:GNAT superfamily N-acetyltransferase